MLWPHGARASIIELLCMWEGTSVYRHTFHYKKLVILHSTCTTGSNKLNSLKRKGCWYRVQESGNSKWEFIGLEKRVLMLQICSLFLKSLLHRSVMPDQPTSRSAAQHFNELICKWILMSSFKFLCWRLTSAGTVHSLLLFHNAGLLTVQLVSCSSGIYLQSDISNYSYISTGDTLASAPLYFLQSFQRGQCNCHDLLQSATKLWCYSWAQHGTHGGSGTCRPCFRFEEQGLLD